MPDLPPQVRAVVEAARALVDAAEFNHPADEVAWYEVEVRHLSALAAAVDALASATPSEPLSAEAAAALDAGLRSEKPLVDLGSFAQYADEPLPMAVLVLEREASLNENGAQCQAAYAHNHYAAADLAAYQRCRDNAEQWAETARQCRAAIRLIQSVCPTPSDEGK